MRSTTKDMKNLCSTIREMAEQPVEKDIKQTFHGTLTEMARQVCSDQAEQLDEAMSRRDRKINRNRTLRKQREAVKRLASSEPSGEELARRERSAKEADAVYRRVTGKPPVNEESTEEAMKRLAAKALKRARKKAGKSSTDDKYAGSKPKAGKTDPDMKNARMRGAMAEEIELAEKAAPGYEDWASDPKVKASFKKQYGKRWKQVMYGRSWNMKKMDEETDLQEGVSAKRKRIIRKAIKSDNDLKPEVADFMKRSFQKQRHRDEILSGGKGAVKALEVRMKRRSDARKAKQGYSSSGYQGLPESEQLDEAGYKRLMRLKKAAYKSGHTLWSSNPSTYGRKMRAAAERESQVAAGMARRGGASPDAVRGGGSRIGKSGKYTQKAGALVNQRDKALQSFRSKVRTAELFGRETDKGAKRERQQAQAAFEKKARTGDFGQDNQAALRARSNFQKRYGRLKGK